MVEAGKESSKLSAADKALHLYERRSGAGIIAGAIIFLFVAVAGVVSIFVGAQGYMRPEFGDTTFETIAWMVAGAILVGFGIAGARHHLKHRSDVRELIND